MLQLATTVFPSFNSIRSGQTGKDINFSFSKPFNSIGQLFILSIIASMLKKVAFEIVQVDEESLRLGAGARESPILVVDRNGGSQVRD